MKKIIVHGGSAHLDDFVAVAEAIAAECLSRRVQPDEVIKGLIVARRDPTQEEVENPDVLVMDVGGVHDPKKACFDHHQLPRGTKECAMTLFAKSVSIDGDGTLFDVMKRLFPWYETRAVLDSCGPFNAAKEEGVEWAVVEKFLGPFEGIVLKAFEATPDDKRAEVVLPFAAEITAKILALKCVKPAVRMVGEVKVVDFGACDPRLVDLVSDALTAPLPDGVAVFKDRRGDGWGLLRIKDDPRIDFCSCKDDPRMGFVHANGFYCTTKEPVGPEVVDEIVAKAATK